MALRPYQQDLKSRLYLAWRSGVRVVAAVLPTGAGKTILASSVLADHYGLHIRAIAHRQELVSQISQAIANAGLPHAVIASAPVVAFCRSQHGMVDDTSRLQVAGVDTLLARGDPNADQVGLWLCDEVHHLQVNNKWGKVLSCYRNAWGLGLTATPIRADGGKLSRASGDGLIDASVVGPTMRDLIGNGYLCDFRIYGPPESLDRSIIPVSQATGDFSGPGMRAAARRSQIVGDVATSYLRIAPGQLGVTFAVDVDMAGQHAAAFARHGVPAAVITAKTPPAERVRLLEAYAREDIGARTFPLRTQPLYPLSLVAAHSPPSQIEYTTTASIPPGKIP